MLWNRVNLDVGARYERKGNHSEGQDPSNSEKYSNSERAVSVSNHVSTQVSKPGSEKRNVKTKGFNFPSASFDQPGCRCCLWLR